MFAQIDYILMDYPINTYSVGIFRAERHYLTCHVRGLRTSDSEDGYINAYESNIRKP